MHIYRLHKSLSIGIDIDKTHVYIPCLTRLLATQNMSILSYACFVSGVLDSVSESYMLNKYF